ncbi:centrosomal protein of 85 kDa isoform X3 [Dendrobates tinctorius]|uniref:centrosomal protein of 85 kDa isoform X3 n=1 Tax=Dendrobates tinctorius TaxID=92724 RepID=UPI003CC933F0
MYYCSCCLLPGLYSGPIPPLAGGGAAEHWSHSLAAWLWTDLDIKQSNTMATWDGCKDSGFQQPCVTGPGMGAVKPKLGNSSSYTEWQTPQMSVKPLIRASASHETQIVSSLPEGISQRADETSEHGSPYAPPAEPSAIEDNRTFEMPNIEPTMNQSALNTLCVDGRFELPTEGMGRSAEQYETLPESKKIGGGELTHRVICPPSYLRCHSWQPVSCSSQPAAEYNSWRLQQQCTDMRRQKLQFVRDYSAPMYAAGLHPTPIEWERVTSDNMILEKEIILERQRQHIDVLEQKLRERELQVHSTVLNQSSPYNDMCLMRLQDLQREFTFLRAQFADKSDSASREKAELGKKLCAMESESRGLREAMKEAAQNHSEDLKKQEERVKGRERHINSLKKKCQKEVEQNKEKHHKIETLERYMANLPTAQDHEKQVLLVKELQEQKLVLQEQVREREKKLGELRANYRESKAQLAAQKLKEEEHVKTIEGFRREIRKFEMTDWKEEERRLTEEANKLRQELESLHKERDSLQNVIENYKKKMEQMFSRMKDLEEQACHEEATGQALKEESLQKEAAIQQLKVVVKDLASQNQDLVDCNLTIQEQVRLASLRAQSSNVEGSQLFTLYKEMNRCQKDLRSICCLLSQRVQGADPNLSMLLGVNSNTGLDEQKEDLDFLSVEKYLHGVEMMKRDIEALRTTISDCYAQDMGENCITQ